MGNYKIKLNINIADILDESNETNIDLERELTEEQACSIDFIDKALLGISYTAMRNAASEHLENISKKKDQN
jgi:hypothetical protein